MSHPQKQKLMPRRDNPTKRLTEDNPYGNDRPERLSGAVVSPWGEEWINPSDKVYYIIRQAGLREEWKNRK